MFTLSHTMRVKIVKAILNWFGIKNNLTLNCSNSNTDNKEEMEDAIFMQTVSQEYQNKQVIQNKYTTDYDNNIKREDIKWEDVYFTTDELKLLMGKLCSLIDGTILRDDGHYNLEEIAPTSLWSDDFIKLKIDPIIGRPKPENPGVYDLAIRYNNKTVVFNHFNYNIWRILLIDCNGHILNHK